MKRPRESRTWRATVPTAALLMATVAVSASASPEQSELAEVRPHVEFLASDALGGRLTGSEGLARAADYIVTQLQNLGAQPLPGRMDFRVDFEYTAGVEDLGSTLALDGGEPISGAERIQALSFSDAGSVEGEAVFAGYGLVVPEEQGYPYDSYATLDVEGKIVVVLRYFPEDVDNEARAVLSRYSGLRYKAMQARERGAAALLVVTGPRSPNAGQTVPISFDTAVSGSGLVAGSADGAVGAALLELAGRDLEQVQAELDTGNPHVTGFDLPVRLDLEITVERTRRSDSNVIGYLPAINPDTGAVPARPFVVLGAHYDHLGRGGGGNSLARGDETGEIHNGADDNASGVAAVLAAAQTLAQTKRNRAVILAFWSGEELGLLGSSDFLRSEVVPADTIAAYINFDMVGRAEENRLVAQAVGSSPVWPSIVERANVPVGFDITMQEDPYLPTDSSAFNSAGIPTISFFTGSHDDYHRPGDDAQAINFEDLARVARLGALVAARVANLAEPPEFVSVERTQTAGGDRDSVRAFTGTIPDYASDIEGLLLGGVIEGGPAEEAGLRAGDVIVVFGGQQIANIYDYTYALDAVKVGEPLQVVYMRDGERHETTLTPRARQ